MTPTQRYVSPELTHFVGRGKSEDEQYSLLIRILTSGWLTHPPHNPNISGNLSVNVAARISDNEMYLPQAVCFCDIPVQELGIHVRKYSRFGLSFLKTFLVPKGASPVFYVSRNSTVRVLPDLDEVQRRMKAAKPASGLDPDSIFDSVPRSELFDKRMKEYHSLFRWIDSLILERANVPGVPKESRQLMEVQQFLDFQLFGFVQFFDDARPDDDPNNFYMEREWRIIGNLSFGLVDVRRVVLPESYARRLRDDVPLYVGQITFVD